MSGCLFNIAILPLLLKLNLLADKGEVKPYMFTFQDQLLNRKQPNFCIPVSQSYTDDLNNVILVDKEATDPVKPIIKILETYTEFEKCSTLGNNVAKNIIAINDERRNPVTANIIDTLTREHNIEETNIKCRRDQFKTLGEIICIKPFEIGPNPSIVERNSKIQTVTANWTQRDYHGNVNGRALAASTYLQSQLMHL